MDDRKQIILTIDDEENIRRSFRMYLEDYDYCVIEAGNGREGIELFEKERPDLVLADLRMPVMDGLEVLKYITASSPETPVIVISGTGVISDAVEALRRGAWEYILKPVEDMCVVRYAVEKTLERAQLLREKKAYHEHLENEVKDRTTELLAINIELSREIEIRQKAEIAARDSEEQLRNIIEATPVGMHIYQLNDRGELIFIGANAAADWILRIDHARLAGKSIQAVYPLLFNEEPPANYLRIAQMGETLKTTRTIEIDGRVQNVYDIHAFAASDSIVVFNFTDSTERHKTAVDREKLIKILENKSAELERYTKIVSKDLRQLVGIIKPVLDMMALSKEENDWDRIRKLLGPVNKAMESIEEKIGDLIDMSRAGQLVSESSVINLKRVADELCDIYEEKCVFEHITIEVTADLPQIVGDPGRIVELYQNLIENAARFRGDQKNLVIQIGYRGSPESPVFFVKDNGSGIASRFHKDIFNLFGKADVNSEGSGIGLTLAKRIVESHGGIIWVESQGNGDGATFCFTLKTASPARSEMTSV